MNTECNYEVSTDYPVLLDALKLAPVVCFIDRAIGALHWNNTTRVVCLLHLIGVGGSDACFVSPEPFSPVLFCKYTEERELFLQGCSAVSLTFIPPNTK